MASGPMETKGLTPTQNRVLEILVNGGACWKAPGRKSWWLADRYGVHVSVRRSTIKALEAAGAIWIEMDTDSCTAHSIWSIVGKLGTHPTATYLVKGPLLIGAQVEIKSTQDSRVTKWTPARINERKPNGFYFMELF